MNWTQGTLVIYKKKIKLLDIEDDLLNIPFAGKNGFYFSESPLVLRQIQQKHLVVLAVLIQVLSLSLRLELPKERVDSMGRGK